MSDPRTTPLALTGVLTTDLMALLRRHEGASIRGGLITGDSITGCEVSDPGFVGPPPEVEESTRVDGPLMFVGNCEFNTHATEPLPEVHFARHVPPGGMRGSAAGRHDGDLWSVDMLPLATINPETRARVIVAVDGLTVESFEVSIDILSMVSSTSAVMKIARAEHRARCALWSALRDPSRPRKTTPIEAKS